MSGLKLERLRYRAWEGRRRWHALRCWPIASTGFSILWRRKALRFFLGLGLLDFLFHFAIVYLVAQIKAELDQRGMRDTPFARMLGQFTFTGTGDSYRDFIFVQGTVVMLLLAFCGSLLLGDDFRNRAVAFYLSKPLGKLQYFLGKLTVASGFASALTLFPAIALYVEYGLFTSSLEYFESSWRILLAIVGYGLLVSVASGVLVLGVAAILQRTVPIVAVWGALLVFLPLLVNILREEAHRWGGEPWRYGLLDFWALLRWISSSMFGIREEVYGGRLPYALAALGVWLGIALWGFWRKVRAVEVVG